MNKRKYRGYWNCPICGQKNPNNQKYCVRYKGRFHFSLYQLQGEAAKLLRELKK